MSAQCCAGRVSGFTASILPGTLLALLPKCPLCLAAWLTFATAITFSEAGAVRLIGTIVVLWIAGLAWALKYFAGLSRNALAKKKQREIDSEPRAKAWSS